MITVASSLARSNMLSTCAMVHLGNVYENLMVNLRPTNAKLRGRMVGIVTEIRHVDRETARALLEENGWNIRAVLASGGN